MLPNRSLFRRTMTVGACAAATALLGCSDASRPVDARAPGSALQALAAPDPSSPVGVIRLLEWCWDHRHTSPYDELFTADYQARCVDGQPDLLRDDELVAAERILSSSQHVRLDVGSLFPVPDSRPGKTAPWHMQVSTTTSLDVTAKTGRTQVEAPVIWYLVRGDSAAIPPDLVARGFGPDPNRWYIEGWWDLSVVESAPGMTQRPEVTMTWCELKRSPSLAAR